jgi:hypothetical protein
MCYDPDPEWDGAAPLAAAQAEAAEKEPAVPQDPGLERCIMCKQDFRPEKVYRTGAGSICFHCSHEFSDESQR